MIEVCDAEDSLESDESQKTVLDQNEKLEPEPNYPDIIPRDSSTKHLTTMTPVQKPGTDLETIFLLCLLFGTMFLLYLVPPTDP